MSARPRLRSNRTLAILAVVACAVGGIACGRSAPPALEDREPVAATEPEAIPRPELSGLEPLVREQLTEGRELLDRTLAREDLGDLERAAAYGQAGMLYLAYNLLEPAEACFRNARLLAPAEPRWSYYLGRLHRSAGDLERSVAAFERVLEARADDVPTLVHLAQVQLERNRADLAEPLLRRALEQDPRAAPALVGLGKIAASGGDPAEAVRHFEAALAIAPEATEIFYPLGQAYRNLGQLDKAQSLLERRGKVAATVEDPWLAELESLTQGWRLFQNRGTALFQEGLYAQALAEFRKAAEAAPDEPVLRVNLGSTLTMLGETAAARREFEQALRLDSRNALAHYNLGTLAARAGDDGRAVEHYRAALETEPDNLRAHFNAANALRRLDRFEEAVGHYRRVVEADPRNADARLGEAFALIRLHRWRDAARRLEEAAAAVPDNRQVRSALTRLLAAAPDDAVRDGARALALGHALLAEESSLPHVVALAMAAAEVGDFRTALDWQGRAIEAVRAAGRSELLPELEENRRRYERGEPCRRPWRDDDPALDPPPLPATAAGASLAGARPS